MSSPFPGMDPYLERPDRWSGVHARLIAVIGAVLARQVAPRFFVDSEDNVYILGLDDAARSLVRPDIYAVEGEGAASLSPARGQIAAPVVLDLPASLEIRAPYLKVIDTADRQVVTTIEVLSPINKVSGSSGQRDFLRKREQILRSSTHWLEIDLLRAGTRPPTASGRLLRGAAPGRRPRPAGSLVRVLARTTADHRRARATAVRGRAAGSARGGGVGVHALSVRRGDRLCRGCAPTVARGGRRLGRRACCRVASRTGQLTVSDTAVV